jgi:MFS family permease
MAQAVSAVFSVFYGALCGAVYGMAGCWFACPARREERFSYWTALTVAAVLMILISGLSMFIPTFRIVPVANVPIILAAVVILAFLISRAFIGKNPKPPQASAANSGPNEKEYNPAPAFLWLLVGLAPIPILLAMVSSRTPRPAWGMSVFFLCVACNLLGGLGCLRGIKNIAVRIILGLFLGAFFFVLSCVVAIFQACSHSGGI